MLAAAIMEFRIAKAAAKAATTAEAAATTAAGGVPNDTLSKDASEATANPWRQRRRNRLDEAN